MARKNYLFTSESVSEGHPDKVCDRISDTIVDAYLSALPEARVACETLATTDRVVIAGEVRGPEAFDLLQAMNTGHDGSMTTVHANTARDALARIEQMIGMSGIDISSRSARAQIASAIQVVVQIGRQADGKRRLLSLSEITGMEGDVISMQEIFRFKQTGRGPEGEVLGRFEATGIRPKFLVQAHEAGIDLPAELFRPEVTLA